MLIVGKDAKSGARGVAIVQRQPVMYLLPPEDAVVIRLYPQHAFCRHFVGNRYTERPVFLHPSGKDRWVGRPWPYF